MSSNPNIELPTEQSKTMDVQTAQRVEQEKLTRRAALRKLGFGAGMAAFALLGVDDLARIVGQRMERMSGDNKVASQVAKEFQEAGVAFAGGPTPQRGSVPLPSGNCNAFQNAGTSGTSTLCNACNGDRLTRCNAACGQSVCASYFTAGTKTCSDAVPAYSDLQQNWAGICGKCLANCN